MLAQRYGLSWIARNNAWPCLSKATSTALPAYRKLVQEPGNMLHYGSMYDSGCLTNQANATQILSDLDNTNAVQERGAHIRVGNANVGSIEGVQHALPVVEDLGRYAAVLVQDASVEAFGALSCMGQLLRHAVVSKQNRF